MMYLRECSMCVNLLESRTETTCVACAGFYGLQAKVRRPRRTRGHGRFITYPAITV